MFKWAMGLKIGNGRALLILWSLTGVFSLLAALATISACWLLNPWFDFWRDAFSDFGVTKACCPWLYNSGLIVSASFLAIFSLFILRSSEHKIESFSSGLLFTSSLFLALIGVFHGGTRPHTFVSTWFFLQGFMSFTVLGISLYLIGDARGIAIAILSGSAPFIAILIEELRGWPSAAVAEAAGISVIAISLIITTIHYLEGILKERKAKISENSIGAH